MILGIVHLFVRCCNTKFKCKKTRDNMVKRLIFSELLALLIEANLDFLTCFVLSW